MGIYCYEATNFAGETFNGEMEAPSSEAVIEHLHRLGYIPLAADRKAGHWFAHLRPKQVKVAPTRRLSLNDISFLTQELAIMLRAGLPLEKALAVLLTLADQSRTKAFVHNLLARVRDGGSLADALAAQKFDLPKGYVGMVRAGETGGARVLETTLERIAEHLKRLQKVREGVFSAMLYPAIVLGMAALSIISILLFVLPQFEPFFQSAPEALPLAAKIVIAAAHGLRDYGLLFLIAAIGAGLVVQRLLRREDLKLQRDKSFLRLPQFGPILVKAEMARFCNTLGVLLANGVTLATALSIAAESLGNRIMAAAAQRVVTRVREGEALSAPMKREPVFPVLALQMIRIGEETGQLDGMLLKTAEIYDRDVQRSVERLMTLLTPVTTIVLGLVIAAIIAAVLSAILSVNDMVT